MGISCQQVLAEISVSIFHVTLDFGKEISKLVTMNLQPTTVKDKDGVEVPAQVATCDVCGGDCFHIFVVNGHNHLQCSNPICNETVCQGGCDQPDPGKCACGEDH